MIYKYQWCNIDLISDIHIHWNEWTMRWKQYKMLTAESGQRSSCRDKLLTREYLGTSLIVYFWLNLLNFFFLLIFFGRRFHCIRNTEYIYTLPDFPILNATNIYYWKVILNFDKNTPFSLYKLFSQNSQYHWKKNNLKIVLKYSIFFKQNTLWQAYNVYNSFCTTNT